jgi:acetoin utilization deacetylase AcuC-like enzyme
MNLFYSKDIDLDFGLYGIEIPIVADRALKVFNQLNLDFNNEFIPFDKLQIPAISKNDLLLCHSEIYINSLFDSYHLLERNFLDTYELIDFEGNYHRYNPLNQKKDFSHAFKIILQQVGMTYLSSKTAIESQFSYFLGGGMHHAMSDRGRGFCLVNDIMITIKKLQNEKLIKNAWVIDVDAHKGDGTAEISKNDKSVATLSIHMKEGWPLNSGSVRDPWFIPSSIDIGIEVGSEETYLNKLEIGLRELESILPNPDLCIVVNGADPYVLDELESTKLLNLDKETMLKRDILVYEFLKSKKIPQSYLMAGGYGERSWEIYYQFLKFVRESSS